MFVINYKVSIIFLQFSNSICRRYDEMAEKVSDVPDTTEEIVGLQEYLKTVSSIEKRYFKLY